MGVSSVGVSAVGVSAASVSAVGVLAVSVHSRYVQCIIQCIYYMCTFVPYEI